MPFGRDALTMGEGQDPIEESASADTSDLCLCAHCSCMVAAAATFAVINGQQASRNRHCRLCSCPARQPLAQLSSLLSTARLASRPVAAGSVLADRVLLYELRCADGGATPRIRSRVLSKPRNPTSKGFDQPCCRCLPRAGLRHGVSTHPAWPCDSVPYWRARLRELLLDRSLSCYLHMSHDHPVCPSNAATIAERLRKIQDAQLESQNAQSLDPAPRWHSRHHLPQRSRRFCLGRSPGSAPARTLGRLDFSRRRSQYCHGYGAWRVPLRGRRSAGRAGCYPTFCCDVLDIETRVTQRPGWVGHNGW